MHKSVSLLATLTVAVAFFLGASAGEAAASTNDVCRFKSDGGMTYNGQTGHSLEFWWRRDTNQLQNGGARVTKWTFPGGGTSSAQPGDPGSVSGSDGITSASAVMANVTLKFWSGNASYPIIVTALLANGASPPATPYVFSGVYAGTSQTWFSGYGVITCGYSILYIY